MPWTVKFWNSIGEPPVTWNYGDGIEPGDVPANQATLITNYLNSIASLSTIAASRLNAFGQDIRIGFKLAEVGKAVWGDTIDDYVLIDIDLASTLYFFNNQGQLVAGDIRLTLMHELAHIYLNAVDPNRNASETTMNGADYDFRGAIVDEQNAIALNANLTNQVQTSYYAAMTSTQALFSYFNTSSSYSDGNRIDITRLGTPGADNIDAAAERNVGVRFQCSLRACIEACGLILRAHRIRGGSTRVPREEEAHADGLHCALCIVIHCRRVRR